MTGISCRRLLAACSLIFISISISSTFVPAIFAAAIFVGPTFLREQDVAADRSPAINPAVAPLIAPSLSPLDHSLPIAPVWIPPPSLHRPYPVVPGTPGFQHLIFPRLVRAAGIIFSGRVTSIGRTPSSDGQELDSTTVTFQVEHAMRGAAPGRRLTIREWAGLWNSGERYRVGERVLLFLYPTGKLGLTSPVAGGLGRFAMDSQDRIMMSAQDFRALAEDPILGGKTVVSYAEFVQAVRRSSRKE